MKFSSLHYSNIDISQTEKISSSFYLFLTRTNLGQSSHHSHSVAETKQYPCICNRDVLPRTKRKYIYCTGLGIALVCTQDVWNFGRRERARRKDKHLNLSSWLGSKPSSAAPSIRPQRARREANYSRIAINKARNSGIAPPVNHLNECFC